MNSSKNETATFFKRPLVAVIATTFIAFVVSFYFIDAGRFDIFQNLFVFPIIIACIYYLKRGVVFSIILSVCYLAFIVGFSEDPIVTNEAFIRVGFFCVIAGFVTVISMQRRRTEYLLYESEERFRTMVETTSDWVWEVDRNGIYTYVSPKVRELLGYEPNEVIGKSPFDLMPPDEAERVGRLFKETIEEHRPIIGLVNINRHKDGRFVVLETNGAPVFDKRENFIGYRGIDRDITKRKQAEDEKVRLINELSESLARIKTLSGLVPICSWCKKIRDDAGYWQQLESYISKHSYAEFSHSICPECMKRNFPARYKAEEEKESL